MTLNGAAIPSNNRKFAEERPISADSKNERSTGRGGAGNFSAIDSDEEDDDFSIPPLKSPVYTSGRGGTGNMQNNNFEHPEYARSSQDVDMMPRRPSASDYHGGRSGAGNVYHPTDEEFVAAEEYDRRIKYDRSVPVDHTRHDYRGWADKGKDFLFKRRNK